tara:strand:+ start:117 stop:602 length:486 start_codon:yes stop_codon:yes gene_type:complete
MENCDIEPILVSGLESVAFRRFDPQYPEQVMSLEGLGTDLVYGPFSLDPYQAISLAKSNQRGIIGEDGSLEYTEESFAGIRFDRVGQVEGATDINNVSRLSLSIIENGNQLADSNSIYWIGFLEDLDEDYVLHGLPANEIDYNMMHAFVVAWNHLSRVDHV